MPVNMTREYYYQVDRDGRVFHDGTEILDAATLRFFLLAMTRTPEGGYLVTCQGERNRFETADTPFVVQRLHLSLEQGVLGGVTLEFAGGYREPLDPSSLETADGHLYCAARRGAFRARFGRIALQQIAPFVTEEDGPVLRLAGRSHPINPVGTMATGSSRGRRTGEGQR
jgi:hypothetical protein